MQHAREETETVTAMGGLTAKRPPNPKGPSRLAGELRRSVVTQAEGATGVDETIAPAWRQIKTMWTPLVLNVT